MASTLPASQRSNHYYTLGLTQSASNGDIRAAFHALALIHHPDKGGDAATFRQIREAYDTLKDEIKRKRYDLTLPIFAQRAARAQAPPREPYVPLRPEDFARRRPPPAPEPTLASAEGYFHRTRPAASNSSQPDFADDIPGSDNDPKATRKDSRNTIDLQHKWDPKHNKAIEEHYRTCPLPVEDCPRCLVVPPRWCESELSAKLFAEDRRKRTLTRAQRVAEAAAQVRAQQNRERAMRMEEKSEVSKSEVPEQMASKADQPETSGSTQPGPLENNRPKDPTMPGQDQKPRQSAATARRIARWQPFGSAATKPPPKLSRVATEAQEAAMEAETMFGSVAW